MSIPEVEQYLPSIEDRECAPTAYAESQGCYVNSDNGNCWWWLRSPGHFSNYAVYVPTGGSFSTSGRGVERVDNAVRPAMWIYMGS